MLEQLLVFTGCPSIQFFNSPPFPNTISEVTLGTLPLTVQHPRDLSEAMPHYWSQGTSRPTLT